MKCVVLLLAAVSWAAASWPTDTVKVFNPNREYRYDYESQILTGIPLLNDQYSGIRIKARVIMHVAADNYVTVKLTGVEVLRVKEEPGVVPTTWVSSSMLESIPAEHAAVLIESLDLPIKFRYNSGIVTKVYAMSSDPYWSVNIKRGIVSMMNLDLNIENPVQEDSIPSKAFMNVVSPDYNIMSAKSTYRVVESSVLGDCETVYSLVPVPSASKMIVSKVIDTKKCSPKVMGESGMFAGVLPGEAFGDMNNIVHPIVAVDYELRGTRHEFLIESAVLTGKYVFAPIMKDMASIDGYVIQKLKYIKDEQIDRPITFPSAPVPLRKGLHAYIPTNDIVMREAFGGISSGGVMEQAKIEMIDNLLEMIIEKTAEKIGSEIPDLISTMVTVMRKMSKSELTEIITKYFSPRMVAGGANIEKKRAIILDVISTLPHPETPIILVQMVQKGYITSDAQGAVLINLACLLVTPSPAVINTFVQMVKEPVIRSKPMTYRAVVLGAGIFINRLVNLHIRMGLPATQTSAILKGAVKELKSMLEISDTDEKMAVVKAIGNAGIVDLFPDIERIIKDKTEPAIIRKEAIFALRRLTSVAPLAIQNVVLPAFLDVREPEDIRIAAFLIVMETKPSIATVYMIGHSINYEPNKQIAAFVYRYLHNIAKTTIPELRPVSVAARRVLMIVRPVIVSPHFYSNNYRWEAFYAKHKIGSIVTVDQVHTASCSIPGAILGKLHVYLYGRCISMAEVGLNITGLDRLARKLFGMKGMMGDIISGRVDIMNIFNDLRAPDWGQMEDVIRQLLKQTDITTDANEAISIAGFIRLMGHEVNYVVMPREEIINVMNIVKSSSIRMMDMLMNGYEVDVVKAVPLLDNSIVMPTPVGLPISVNFSFVSAMAIKGEVKVEGVTRLSAIFTDPTKVTLVAAIRPSVSVMAYHTVGILHDIIETGTTVKGYINADMPMSLKVIVDKKLEKISVNMGIPRRIAPTLSAGIVPMLFTHFVPLRPTDYSASLYDMHLPKGVPMVCDKVAKAIPISMERVIPIVFMKAVVGGSVSYPLPPVVDPVLIAISRHEVSIVLKPTSSTPEAILLEVMYGEQKTIATRKTEESASWFGWFTKDEPVEEPVVADEFAPVEASPLIPQPIKAECRINMMTVGGYDDAKIKTRITLLYDPLWKIYQTVVQVVGSPFVAPLWKAKFESVVNIPKVLETVIAAPRRPAPGIIAKTVIAFGTESFTDNTIIIKVLPVREEESPIWPIVQSALVPTIVKSVNVKLVVDYTGIERKIKAASIPVVEMIKPYILPYVIPYFVKEEMSQRTSITTGRESIEAVVQIVPYLYKINAVIAYPSSTYYVSGIPIPDVIPMTQLRVPTGFNLSAIPTLPWVTALTEVPEDIPSALYGICVVAPTNISTIDGVTIVVPDMDPSCEIVLAHDCSVQKLYTVVSTPVSPNGMRAIKVIVPGFKVEIARGLVHQGVIIKVNDAIESVAAGNPLIITEPVGEVDVPVLNITRDGPRHVIRAPQVGIEVVTDGIVVKVKVSPLLRGTACGICNHIPAVPIASGPSVIPTINGTYPVTSVLQRYIVRSAQCPDIRAPVMPAF